MEDLTGLGKLVEVVGRGVSRLLRPWMIGRDLKALTTAVDSARAELGLPVSSVSYEGLEVSFTKSAEQQAAKERENLKSIVQEARTALPPSVSEEPVSDEFVGRFFDEAPSVSNSELQKIWGRLLAGEVAKPGSVGFRTLAVIRNLSPAEARLFQAAALFSVGSGVFDPHSGWGAPPDQVIAAWATQGLDAGTLRLLEDAGLVRTEIGSSLRYNIYPDGTSTIPLAGRPLRIKHPSKPTAQVTLPAAYWTTSAKELLSALRPVAPDEVVSAIVLMVTQQGFELVD